MLTDRILMGPGPCNPYPEVVEAMGRPMLGHLDPEFLFLLDETCERLRQVFQTNNALTLPVSGTGSAGMEAAFVNVVKPGDLVVVGVNGLFGERMTDVAARCGAEVIRVEAEWGTPLDPQALLDAHPNPAIIALVHAETSTGVRNDVAHIGANKPEGTLLLIDTVTSIGGIELDIDGWGVDIAYAGTQKCLGVPPGLAPLTYSEAARARILDKPQSWYLDLSQIASYVDADGGARKYHHTAPISMIFGLHAGLGVILEEGLRNAWARHEEAGRALQDGLEKRGYELVAPVTNRLPELTTVWVPTGVDDAFVRRALLEKYGIEIGGGVGPMAGKAWRIGCMGHTARLRNVATLLAALDEVVTW